MIAVDTNVLVGAIQTFDPQVRASARRAVKSLYRQGEQLLSFPQNLVEFWNVVHHVNTILSFDLADFKRFTGVTVIHPNSL